VDNLTREQRSYMMSRVRSKDTQPELLVRKLAHARGLRLRIPVHREHSFRFNVNTDSADAEQRFRPS
jgi:G:T-mismatch repair DNA endonuclease (very short patch repair protein)